MHTTYMGMDIHKNFIQAVAMDKDGNILKEQMFKPDLDGIKGFVKEFTDGGKTKAAIEASCTWWHVYELLDSQGIETILVNARRTKVIAQSKIKTDKLDARGIANCLRTGFIATAYIPPKDVMEQRTLLRHRISINRDIARRKNRVHGILLMCGAKSKYVDICGEGGRGFLKELRLSDANRYNLESHLNIIDALTKERVQITKKVEKLCKVNKKAMLLTSIKGVSFYSAMIIITELGDIGRFSEPKKACSYAGLVPRTIQSGEHCVQGRIIKECNQYLKWILNQCVHTHIRYCPESPITKLYYRVMAKHGKGKATIAASRKMLTCMYHMLVKNELFKYN